MAAVDTYVYLGDEQITGGAIGQKPSPAFPQLVGLARLMPEMQRVVPSGADGITGGAYPSYYDGLATVSYAASAATSTVLTAVTPNWKPSALVGKTLTITSGTGAGQSRTISANTAATATVSSAFSPAPTAGSVFNVGPGSVIPFHYSRNLVLAGNNGDNWFEQEALTPCTMWMQRLGRQYGYSVGPGFRMFKLGNPGGAGSGSAPWKPGQAGWTAFLAYWTNFKDIEEGKGNTLNVKAVVLDMSTTDIFNVNLNYQADMLAVIDGIRSLMGSSVLIVIVNQHQMLLRTTVPVAAPQVRAFNKAITSLRTNVVLYDMNWGNLTWQSGGSITVPAPDPRFYDLETYIQAGVGIHNTIQAKLSTFDPPDGTLGALATVVMMGDSQLVTAGINPLLAFLTVESSLLGDDPLNLSSVRSDCWIFDDATQMLLPYDVMSNASPYGPVPPATLMGPECSMIEPLKAKYPNGVAIFKYARSGVSLTSAAVAAGAPAYCAPDGPTFADWRTKFAVARLSAIRDLGRSLDVIGSVFSLGENDLLSDAAVTDFETQVPDFVDQARTLFTTSSDSSKPLPVVWIQGAPPSTEVSGGSTLGPADRRNRYRSAVAALATQKQKLTVLLNAGPQDYELQRTDRVHYSGRAVLKLGVDIAAALIALNKDEAETGADTAVLDVPSGAAAFVVETGAGLTNSNALVDIAFVDEYARTFGNPSSWANASVAEKKDAIRTMTRWMNTRLQYDGSKFVYKQACAFPRVGLVDEDDFSVDSNTVPLRAKQACAEGAIRINAGSWEPFPDQDPTENSVASESVSVSGISVSQSFGGAKNVYTEIRLSVVDAYLAPFLARVGRRISR